MQVKKKKKKMQCKFLLLRRSPILITTAKWAYKLDSELNGHVFVKMSQRAMTRSVRLWFSGERNDA